MNTDQRTSTRRVRSSLFFTLCYTFFYMEMLRKELFPPLLAEINDPPKELYVRGTLPSTEHKWIAVVGSRKYTPYGKQICERLIHGLRGKPVVIVSGLALGIDGIAHAAALDAGLPTVAVPGSGLDDTVLYPSSHRKLAKRILESGGALLSELEPTTRAQAWCFPQRNRIMAGLCHATLVVEAREQSGTLITARLAMDYNRDVLAVPGPVTSPNSEGPHRLIRDGAALIRSADDILAVLGLEGQPTLPFAADSLSTQEQLLVRALASPLPRDELAGALNIDISALNVLVSSMELKGLIKEEFGALRLTW